MLAKMMDTPYDVSRAILRHGEGVDILPANIELSGVGGDDGQCDESGENSQIDA